MFSRPFKLHTHLPELTARSRLQLLLLIVLLVVGISTTVMFFRIHLNELNDRVAESHKISNAFFSQALAADSEGLARALTLMANDHELLELLKQSDVAGLMKSFSGVFDHLKKDFEVTHAYFINPEGMVLLRAHKPHQFGDILKRASYLQAAESKKLACGIEMGMNFYSLRCVMPVFLKQELVGYIELAEEINSIFNELKQVTKDDYIFLLRDDLFKQFHQDHIHERASTFDILYTTDQVLAHEVLSQANLTSSGTDSQFEFISNDNKHYGVGTSAYQDISGDSPGVLISIADITTVYNAAIREMWINILGAICMVVATIFIFIAAIKRSFRTMENKLEERTRQIEFMALHDTLTNLPNRAMFSKLVQQQTLESRRYKRTFSLLFIDLDGFKAVNDTLGHDSGDQLLTQVASRLSRCIRDSDIAARLGGDEFVILLPEMSGEDEQLRVDIVANRILLSLAKVFSVYTREVRISASIGVSSFPQHGESEDELMKHADAAMYAAKASGKNTVQRYTESLHKESFERRSIEADLRQAIANNEFELYYQAKLDSQSRDVVGMEALIRWHHPHLGMVEPNDFIDIAEETGLIIPIGKWVLETACQQMMEWQGKGLGLATMAINISPKQLRDEALLSDIDEALSKTGVSAQQLILEITEYSIVQNTDIAIEVLTGLQAKGIKIAIDDIGTGYSSFSRLETFPVDSVKIDRCFIHGLPNNESHRAITEAIITMANRLGLAIVAEGVETEEQLVFFQEHKCDQLQGFYFNSPMAAGTFEQYVKSSKAN